MTGRTTTDSAVGMEPQGGGMHNENSAVEAIGRLEELARSLRDREVARFILPAALADRTAADLRLVLESLRHSVEREAGLREALEPFARWAEHGTSREYIASDAPDDGVCAAISFRAGDFRKARAALDRRAGT